jgi:hypothetical protein
MKSSDPTCGPPNCRPMRGPDGVVSRSVAVAQQSLVELAGGQARQLGLDVDRAGHLNEARCSARTRWARVRTRDRARHRRPGARLAVDPSSAICGSPTGTRQFESGVIVCAKAQGAVGYIAGREQVRNRTVVADIGLPRAIRPAANPTKWPARRRGPGTCVPAEWVWPTRRGLHPTPDPAPPHRLWHTPVQRVEGTGDQREHLRPLAQVAHLL